MKVDDLMKKNIKIMLLYLVLLVFSFFSIEKALAAVSVNSSSGGGGNSGGCGGWLCAGVDYKSPNGQFDLFGIRATLYKDGEHVQSNTYTKKFAYVDIWRSYQNTNLGSKSSFDNNDIFLKEYMRGKSGCSNPPMSINYCYAGWLNYLQGNKTIRQQTAKNILNYMKSNGKNKSKIPSNSIDNVDWDGYNILIEPLVRVHLSGSAFGKKYTISGTPNEIVDYFNNFPYAYPSIVADFTKKGGNDRAPFKANCTPSDKKYNTVGGTWNVLNNYYTYLTLKTTKGDFKQKRDASLGTTCSNSYRKDWDKSIYGKSILSITELTTKKPSTPQPEKATLKIIKEDTKGNRLAGAKFEIKTGCGTGCSNGKVVKTCETNSNGECEIKDLEKRKYCVVEVKPPSGYLISGDVHDDKDDENNQKSNNSLNWIVVRLGNQPNGQLTFKNKHKSEPVLYQGGIFKSDCLNFTYDDESIKQYTISGKNKDIYCRINYSVDKTIDFSKAVNSGEMYFTADDGIIMSGYFTRTCFSANGQEITKDEMKGIKAENFIDSVYLGSTKLSFEEYEDDIEDDINDDSYFSKNDNNEFTYTTALDFKIPEVLVDLNGKKSTSEECKKKNCKSIGYGIISPLYSSNKAKNAILTENYEFKVNLITGVSNSTNTNNICEFKYKNNIPLDFDFRIISTENPFVSKNGSKRKTMTNWCYEERKNNFSQNVNFINEETQYTEEKIDIPAGNEIPSDETGSDGDEVSVGDVIPENIVVNKNGNLESSKQEFQNVQIGFDKDNILKFYRNNGNLNDQIENMDYYKDGVINAIDAFNIANIEKNINISEQANNTLTNDCSSDNLVVQAAIKEAPNSYGLQKGEKVSPKYKIVLTPQLIKKIKEIAKNNSITYDKFNLECVNLEDYKSCDNSTKYKVYRSKLINELFKENDIVINYSTKRKIGE